MRCWFREIFRTAPLCHASAPWPTTISPEKWIAWQFASLDGRQGFVQAFRRGHCICAAAELKLRGLKPNSAYVLKNYDTDHEQRVTGQRLMETGMPVDIPEKPGAVTVRYVRLESSGRNM